MGISASMLMKDTNNFAAAKPAQGLKRTLSASLLLSPRTCDCKYSPNSTCVKCQKSTFHLNNLKDDAESFRSKVEALKLIIKNDTFRLKFMEFVRWKGKASFIDTYQRLEKLRKLIIQVQTGLLIVTDSLSISNIHDKNIFDDLVSLTKAISVYCVIHESIELIESFDKEFFIDAEDTVLKINTLTTSNIAVGWTRRINRLQDDLLSSVFDEFEQFVDSEEFKTIRHTTNSSAVITVTTASTTTSATANAATLTIETVG